MEKETRKIKRILNINNLTENQKDIQDTPVEKIEQIIKNKINSDLNVTKFLGQGYYGPLFLLENKKIQKVKNDNNFNQYSNNSWMSNFNWTWNSAFGNNKNSYNSHNSHNSQDYEANLNSSILMTNNGHNGNNNINNQNQNNTREMICKIISMKKDKREKMYSALLEMGILSVLSKDIDTNSYINNCLGHKVVNDNLFTFFPAFTGYKIKNVIPYLKKLPQKDFKDLSGYLMRHILFGLQAIHQQKIAHQNINDCSIVVSMHNNKIMSIKFMDFGAGCGVYKTPGSHDLNVEKCLNDLSYFQSIENSNNNLDTLKGKHTSLKKVYKYIMDGLTNLQDIDMAQSYDIWCCGLLFYDLLHAHSLSNDESACVLDGLDDPSLAWDNSGFTNFRKPLKNQKGYANIIQSHMLSPIKERYGAKDVLEEMMIYDKFGGK